MIQPEILVSAVRAAIVPTVDVGHMLTVGADASIHKCVPIPQIGGAKWLASGQYWGGEEKKYKSFQQNSVCHNVVFGAAYPEFRMRSPEFHRRIPRPGRESDLESFRLNALRLALFGY